MIDREYVEKKHIKARNWQGQISVNASALAELCRVYLAWLDAPEARPLELQCNGFDDPDRERLDKLVKSGKRVRLVEVKE